MADSGNAEKLCAGPTPPIPGPMLPKRGDRSTSGRNQVVTIKGHDNGTQSKNREVNKEEREDVVDNLLLNRPTVVAHRNNGRLGCNMRFSSAIAFLAINMCLTILIPPEVEPADAPKNINKKKVRVKK